jgi:hypothetical protein
MLKVKALSNCLESPCTNPLGSPHEGNVTSFYKPKPEACVFRLGVLYHYDENFRTLD